MSITREAFIERYCARSGVSWEWLRQYRDAVPCRCTYKLCEGWAMIPREDAPLLTPPAWARPPHL